jgi:hypothetical protein
MAQRLGAHLPVQALHSGRELAEPPPDAAQRGGPFLRRRRGGAARRVRLRPSGGAAQGSVREER